KKPTGPTHFAATTEIAKIRTNKTTQAAEVYQAEVLGTNWSHALHRSPLGIFKVLTNEADLYDPDAKRMSNTDLFTWE
uniref:hypothetical protein n=1 Tax=Salmonella sp. s54412 TaxID=3160128 RepID=UPI0037549666